MKKILRKCGAALGKAPVIGPVFEPKPKIAVIRMSGIITDTASRKATISLSHFEKPLEEAFDIPHLEAVALVINSPGGSPAQSELLGNTIRRLAEEADKPVLAFVEDVAASGGYWLACAADEIYAAETSIVGSIGVISASFGFQDFIEKYGVERRVHTAGKEKSFLDPFKPENPTDIKRLKTIQAELHESFKNWVSQRRAEHLKGADKDLFEGQFWTAPKAQELGIIDGIGGMKAVCRAKLGEDVKFIDLSPGKGFFSELIGADLSLSRDLLNTAEERSLWARYGL